MKTAPVKRELIVTAEGTDRIGSVEGPLPDGQVNAGVKKAVEDPAVRKRIEDTGSLIVANTPDQFAAQIKAEYDVYKKVVDQSKLKLD